jgi:beta-fructofuranosidase
MSVAMTLRIADRWLWDFWTVTLGRDVHAFYLQAGRELGDAELRHWNVTIGHAVSSDLERWEILPDALAPGAPGTFDDRSTWTGSIIAHDGVWKMLYTGTSSLEDGLVQRVGLATSTDLTTWARHPESVFEADPRWYELLDRDVWHDQAWRDPWLFRVTGDDAVHAYVTARANDGDPRGRGVIGHARSHDLVHWEVLPPVTEPMGFGQMEVPQLVEAGGRFHLLFSSDPGTRSEALGLLGSGTYCLSGPTPFGPFDPATLHELDAGPDHVTYAGRVVPHRDAQWFLAWIGYQNGGTFLGELARPRAVAVGSDGTLTLGRPR